jgi:hypothetical protein
LASEAAFVSREAKRKRKLKKIRAVDDDADSMGRGASQQKKRKSAFDNDIVNVQRKNVKRLRHVANAANRGSGRKKARKF